jgi:dTMP kinase
MADAARDDTRRRYPLVALEGPDAAGKTTIRTRLFARLEELGHSVLSTVPFSYLSVRETEVITNARFRRIPYPPAEITSAYVRDKELLGRTLFQPQLEWRPVLVDRYLASDMVYHEVLWGIPPDTTYRAYVESAVTIPDLTILVETPVDVAQARLKTRDPASLRHWDAPDVQKRIAAGFHAIYTEDQYSGLGESIIVDNSGPLEQTFRVLEEEVLPRLTARTGDAG